MLGEEEVFFDCPYCGERISMLIDASEPQQAYVEDCEVCCRPIAIATRLENGTVQLDARRSDE